MHAKGSIEQKRFVYFLHSHKRRTASAHNELFAYRRVCLAGDSQKMYSRCFFLHTTIFANTCAAAVETQPEMHSANNQLQNWIGGGGVCEQHLFSAYRAASNIKHTAGRFFPCSALETRSRERMLANCEFIGRGFKVHCALFIPNQKWLHANIYNSF
jgi:hypothetical protein